MSEDEEIPCDLVVMSCEDPEGTCYITTANLDGETNLKVCLPFCKFCQNFPLNTVVLLFHSGYKVITHHSSNSVAKQILARDCIWFANCS